MVVSQECVLGVRRSSAPESESGEASGNGKMRSSVSVPEAASGSSCQQWVMIVVHRGLQLADHRPRLPPHPHTHLSESHRFFRWNRIVLWFGLLSVDAVRHLAIGDEHVSQFYHHLIT